MLYDQIQEATDYIRTVSDLRPEVGIILGTGLGKLADEIELEAAIPYADIPHFPVSTAPGHAGRLLLGRLGGRPVVMMAGRFHYYEGYSMQQVTFPVRVMKFLGADKLLASNAAGGTREEVAMGDIVFIRDHINLLPDNPLRGPNDERLGPRFPDMSKPYDRTFNARGLALAPSFGLRAHEGVYVSLPGPNLETPAEYGFVHTIGGWVVGMSTVPEVLVARHMDMQVAVVSVVSNKCWPPEAIGEVTVEDVIAAVEAVAPRLRRLVTALVAEWR